MTVKEKGIFLFADLLLLSALNAGDIMSSLMRNKASLAKVCLVYPTRGFETSQNRIAIFLVLPT